MELKITGVAGTLESSDAMITVEPAGPGIDLSVESSVLNQYGRQIKKTVLETLDRLGVKNARVSVKNQEITVHDPATDDPEDDFEEV